MNAIGFGGDKGRNQKTTACSEDVSSKDYFLALNEQKNKGGLTLGFAKQYQNKPRPSDLSPFSLSKDYFIHSMWSQNTEKKKQCHIPDAASERV